MTVTQISSQQNVPGANLSWARSVSWFLPRTRFLSLHISTLPATRGVRPPPSLPSKMTQQLDPPRERFILSSCRQNSPRWCRRTRVTAALVTAEALCLMGNHTDVTFPQSDYNPHCQMKDKHFIKQFWWTLSPLSWVGKKSNTGVIQMYFCVYKQQVITKESGRVPVPAPSSPEGEIEGREKTHEGPHYLFSPVLFDLKLLFFWCFY